jgi:hypothetical protein
MRDLGILPEQSAQWRFLPHEAVTTEQWKARNFNDAKWLHGESPFHYDRDLFDLLASRRSRRAVTGSPKEVLFRCKFSVTPSPESLRYRLELTSRASAVAVWVNGFRVEPEGTPRSGRYTFSLGTRGAEPRLDCGRNVIAVSAKVPSRVPTGELLLSLRLDEVRRPRVPEDVEPTLAEEVTDKLVTHRAAVCDLCTDLPGREQACVRACPHEATVRVDARREFPQDGGE